MDETNRRREKQVAYNKEHGITPVSIRKSTDEVILSTGVVDSKRKRTREKPVRVKVDPDLSGDELIALLEKEMLEAAAHLEFEKAASLRDRIFEIRSTGS